MTWTYSNTDLSTTLAQVRLKIGDTDSEHKVLTDEEIATVTDNTTDILLAGIECIDLILGQLARATDTSGAGISTSRSQKVRHWQDLKKSLESQTSLQADAFLAGTSKSEQQTLEADPDWKGVSFEIGMDDN